MTQDSVPLHWDMVEPSSGPCVPGALNWITGPVGSQFPETVNYPRYQSPPRAVNIPPGQ